MSKSPAKARRKKSDGLDRRRPSTKDGSIYFGLLVIGAFAVGIAFLLGGGKQDFWGSVALGYLAALAWLTHIYAFKIYRGHSLANWQCALARLPLRLAGYGTKHGKPVEAAHGSEKAKMAIMAGAAVSILILLGLSFLLIPGMTGLMP